MADITQTPANVAPGANSLSAKMQLFGEAVTQGMPVYVKAADSKWYKAKADTAESAKATGIALSPVTAPDTYGLVAMPSNTEGQALVNLGATLTVGQVYVVSAANAGGIAPYSDLGSGKYVTILGVAISTALLDLRCLVSNIAKP